MQKNIDMATQGGPGKTCRGAGVSTINTGAIIFFVVVDFLIFFFNLHVHTTTNPEGSLLLLLHAVQLICLFSTTHSCLWDEEKQITEYGIQLCNCGCSASRKWRLQGWPSGNAVQG